MFYLLGLRLPGDFSPWRPHDFAAALAVPSYECGCAAPMTTVSDAQLGAKLPRETEAGLARIEALALAQRRKAYRSTTPGEQGSVAGSLGILRAGGLSKP